MKAYSAFAEVYDSFMDNIPYDAWADRIAAYLTDNGYENCPLLELGCGTGSMTIRMAQKGYQVMGTDLSTDMLKIAVKRSKKAGVEAYYWQRDMCAESGFCGLPVVLAVCDTMNYLVDEEELAATLRSVYDTLDEGGVFLFDLKTRAFFEELGDGTFTDTNKKGTYIWENEFDPETGDNYYNLTIFIAGAFGRFRKVVEPHVQHVFATDLVLRVAKECGFTTIEHKGMDLVGPADESAERTYFALYKDKK